MSRLNLLILLMLGSPVSIGQNISVTFSPAGAATVIDSVTATNLRTNKFITFPGNETLILSVGTGISPADATDETSFIFPNPFSGRTTLSILAQKPETVNFKVLSLVGQVVAESSESIQPGGHQFNLSVSTAGIYLVCCSSGQGTATFKVICIDAGGSGNSISYLGQEYNNHNNQSPPGIKSAQTTYNLGYKTGEIVHYTCYSSIFTTIKTDIPVSSRNYTIDFAACTDRAGRNYPIVAIGSQTWMAENMAWLPSVVHSGYGSDDQRYYYVPGYEGMSISEAKATANYKKYGTLYNSPAALNGEMASNEVPSGVRGICPEGWHLPSRGEVLILAEYLGMNAGTKLKSTTGWNQNANGNNSRGFDARPGGCRYTIPGYWAGFSGIGSEADFWTSSETGWGTSGTTVGAGEGSMGLSSGYSVRCVKNPGIDNSMPVAGFSITPESGTISTVFTFDASGSSDAETPPSHLLFRWDWNGDGDWDTEFSTNPVEFRQFSELSIFVVKLEVIDEGRLSDTDSKVLAVANTFYDNRETPPRPYKYKDIGTQTWMMENLAWLPSVSNSTTASENEPVYYVYGYEGSDTAAARASVNFKAYGALYNWPAAMGGGSGSISVPSGVQGACPDGWHLPSDGEWKILEKYLGMSQTDLEQTSVRYSGSVGIKLKSTFGWKNSGNGTNSTGLTILPGGYRNYYNGFTYMGENASFWSTSKIDPSGAWGRQLFDFSVGIHRDDLKYRPEGYSVRCLLGQGARVAILTTDSIKGITGNSATGGGNITNDGGSAVNFRGICWSLVHKPTTTGNRTNNGSGTGAFTGSITGLKGNTTYYVRAYAINGVGTSYGNEVSFKTIVGMPTLTTAEISSIKDIKASGGGTVVNDGGAEVIARGVCWSLSGNPTTEDNFTSDGIGAGTFASNLTGLIPNTSYHVRAYATSSVGTAYGEDRVFTTYEGTFDYEGRNYTYKTIGTQTWMTENLAWLPSVTFYPTVSDTIPYYYVTGYEGTDVNAAKTTDFYKTYGVMYNWSAAMNMASYSDKIPSGLQGVCPDGWHMPSDGEWKVLEKYLGMNDTDLNKDGWRASGSVGAKLKAAGPAWGNGGSNSSGFTALPASMLNTEAEFWSTTNSTYGVWKRRLDIYDNGVARQSSFDLSNRLSVRCIRGQGVGLARVATAAITGITGSTARGGGNVSYEGGLTVTARGVCWSTLRNPTTSGAKIVDGAGPGEFSSTIDGLAGSTTYYVRAYATNSLGTSYGEQKSFTTLAGPPSVSTADISAITDTTALSGGTIVQDGDSPVTARGVCWSASQNPTVNGPKTSDGQGSGTYISRLTGLKGDRTYYVRAYATNSYGTSYGNQKVFTTPEGTFLYHERIYAYKTIGTQTWMTENLAYLPSVMLSSNGSETSPRYYVYQYEGTNVAAARNTDGYKTYGALFNWPAAMNGAAGSAAVPSGVQGICPGGWHLPSDVEWKILERYLGMSDEQANSEGGRTSGNVALQLKEAGTKHWMSPNARATNSSGFNVLPGGLRYTDIGFDIPGYSAYFWTASNYDASAVWGRSLYYGDFDGVYRAGYPKNFGFSVRCLRN